MLQGVSIETYILFVCVGGHAMIKIVGKGFDPLLSKQSLVCFRSTNLQYCPTDLLKAQIRQALTFLSLYRHNKPQKQIIQESKIEYNLKRLMNLYIILVINLLALSIAHTCPQASVPNPHSICITPNYIQGCSQYLNDHQCATCNYRYALQSDGLCQLNTQTTQDCCQLRGPNNQCLTCQPGLYLIEGRCTESNIVGCLEKDSNGVCINCAADFILKNGVCSKGVKNCNKYADINKSICSECQPSYSLTSNICVANQILGCKMQENKACLQCFRPFLLKQGKCVIENCQTYNEYNCIACECGYYLNLQGSCKIIDYGCMRYHRGFCSDCLPGFRLKANSCQMEGCKTLGLRCEACEDNYELINGICKMKNCISWKDGSCQICSQGFNYHLGTCVQGTKVVSE